MIRLRRTGLFLLLAGLSFGSWGCSAAVARAKVLQAETSLGAAQRAGAEERAPYEYTAAVLYLEKARELEAYARFGPSREFGALSEKMAESARAKAIAAETEPDLPDLQPRVVSPRGDE